MELKRLSPYSQKYKVIMVEGVPVTVPVVEDLNDEQLLDQIRHFIDAEDFECVEHLCTEAALRNLPVKQFFTTAKKQ